MKKKECESCKFWRFKSSDEKAYGICENPAWKVSMMSEGFLRRFADVEEWVILEILKSIRTEGTFLCNQYEADK